MCICIYVVRNAANVFVKGKFGSTGFPEGNKCLEIWCGDHRQTPGGLQQTNEAKRFRRKLIRRPLALRCKTKYVQPQELGSIVCQHLTGPTGSPPATLAQWLQGTATPATEDVQTIWREVTGLNAEQPALPSQLQKAALAILWLAAKGEELTEVLSTTYAEAAGVDGKQCWGLVLSCSARVTLMTYQVVVGVRYLCPLLLPGNLDASSPREKPYVVRFPLCFGTFLVLACMRWVTSASSLTGYVKDKTLRLTPDLVWPSFTIRTVWSMIFDPAVGSLNPRIRLFPVESPPVQE